MKKTVWYVDMNFEVVEAQIESLDELKGKTYAVTSTSREDAEYNASAIKTILEERATRFAN